MPFFQWKNLLDLLGMSDIQHAKCPYEKTNLHLPNWKSRQRQHRRANGHQHDIYVQKEDGVAAPVAQREKRHQRNDGRKKAGRKCNPHEQPGFGENTGKVKEEKAGKRNIQHGCGAEKPQQHLECAVNFRGFMFRSHSSLRLVDHLLEEVGSGRALARVEEDGFAVVYLSLFQCFVEAGEADDGGGP